jgi:1,4-dihydroxy-2-naphthoate octaprenyltransferase
VTGRLKVWTRTVRAPFLLLSVVLAPVGAAAAWWEAGKFSGTRFILTLVGLILAHISVNVFNEYLDYRSEIDLNTTRTPFSGGSGVLPAGLLRPADVYKLGIGALVAALGIGLYLMVLSGPLLLALIGAGGVAICFYTTHFTRWGIGELVAGLGLGSLPVLGGYFVQTGCFTVGAVLASLAPGFLTANLLLLNEFPDAEADRRGGRAHLVILLGKHRAAYVYVALLLVTYLAIVGGVAARMMPLWCLLALLTLPIAWKAGRTALKYHDDLSKLIPGLAANVQTILGTDLLLALGYSLARAVGG